MSSIAYTDTAGAPQTLAKALYAVDTERAPGRVVPAYGEDWPSTRETINAVSVTYKAGYGAAGSSVPQALRHAILLLAGHWYEHREAVSERPSLEETPQALAALVSQYQVDIYPVNAG